MPDRLERRTYAYLREVIVITKALSNQLKALERVLSAGVNEPDKAHIACQSALQILEGMKFTHDGDQ